MNKKPSTLPAMLMAPAVFGGELDPVHVAHSGTFDLEAPPGRAIHLFTAPGETLWAPGWDPTILSGDGTEAGTVFVTTHGQETTIWVVVDFDADPYRARYARVTPGSRAGSVEVRLQPNASGGSTVEVRYELTALTEAGNESLAGFDATAYAEMLEEWERHIRHADIDYEVDLPR